MAVIIPLLIIYYIWCGRHGATLRVSSIGGLRAPRTLRYWLQHLPIVLRMGAIAMIIIAMARPVERHSEEEVTVDGIDIVMAMDISTSMLAADFTPDRMEAAKQIAAQFAADREGERHTKGADRLGIAQMRRH